MGCTPPQRRNESIPQSNVQPSAIVSKGSNAHPSIEEIINNEHVSQTNFLVDLDVKMNEEYAEKVYVPRMDFETKTVVAQ
jgi:hypothetical protein